MDFNEILPSNILFYTVKDLSKMLGVSDTHVLKLIDIGELETGVDLSLGNHRSCIRVPRSSVVKFLNDRKTA
jgi:excisionase family DNA binding protein